MSITYTPMMEQYLNIKKEHPNEILFFRMGDFYEMFFDDAKLASKELEITLTGREGGTKERVPMCGIPYHSAEGYIAKLIKKGYRVAICEQVEDPKASKGLVKREVIRIVTPGTTMIDQVLEDKTNQYLLLIYEENKTLYLVAADVSTGECLWTIYSDNNRHEKAQDFIYQIMPVEIVHLGEIENWENIKSFCQNKIPECMFTEHHIDSLIQTNSLVNKHFGDVSNLPKQLVVAVGHLLSYLYITVKSDLSHINRLNELNYEYNMMLDATAMRNLEVLKNMRDGSKKDTLLSVLDFTCTAMGGRQLKRWLERPLLDIRQITMRQQVIKELLQKFSVRASLVDKLSEIYDIERILSRVEVGTANARDLAALKASLATLPNIKQELASITGDSVQKLVLSLDLHVELYELLAKALVEEPPFSIREGGMIKEGYDKDLDELKHISRESRNWLTDFEVKQREVTGIKNLKVGFNKVFGYYIEVTRSNLQNVPDNFVRKQTLANAERYIVPELKEFENKILGAQERIEQLEYYLFNDLREKVRGYIASLQNTARAVADIDVFASLATAADKYNYICPVLNDRQEVSIKDGRHPVIERLLKQELFVPNDSFLNVSDHRTILITGPNMAGKSTYMRQVALLVLMTQIGSFIPAREASISPVDRIFTRVGASDDLSSGQSTFMVEMTEVAQILKYATDKSLIILDEVGRGTSTYDGMSIAQSVIEYISDKIKAKTLFATHYHELMDLEGCLVGLKNYSVAVKERGNEVVFLRRIIPGGADKSYGIHVAQLAGLPKKLLKRSEELLSEYSSSNIDCACKQVEHFKKLDSNAAKQETLFTSSITTDLVSIDIATMTPLEALNKIFELQKQAKQEVGML